MLGELDDRVFVESAVGETAAYGISCPHGMSAKPDELPGLDMRVREKPSIHTNVSLSMKQCKLSTLQLHHCVLAVTSSSRSYIGGGLRTAAYAAEVRSLLCSYRCYASDVIPDQLSNVATTCMPLPHVHP